MYSASSGRDADCVSPSRSDGSFVGEYCTRGQEESKHWWSFWNKPKMVDIDTDDPEDVLGGKFFFAFDLFTISRS